MWWQLWFNFCWACAYEAHTSKCTCAYGRLHGCCEHWSIQRRSRIQTPTVHLFSFLSNAYACKEDLCLSIGKKRQAKQWLAQQWEATWTRLSIVKKGWGLGNLYVRVRDSLVQLRLRTRLPTLPWPRLLCGSHSHSRLPPVHRRSTFRCNVST